MSSRRPNPFSSISLIAFLAAPMAARADGVTDFIIDPAAGYVITEPGSYSLASDANMAADVDAVTVAADNVTVDLNGHTITGNGQQGRGINCGSSRGVVIRNGRILKTALNGIEGSGDDCVASDLVVADGDSSGIVWNGNGGRVSRCKASGNGYYGIRVAQRGSVDDCEANGNNRMGDTAGISAGDGSMIRDCQSNGNSALLDGTDGAGSGIVVGPKCAVRNCVVNDNQGIGAGAAVGIDAGSNCLIEANSCAGQTSGATGAYAAGIRALAGGKILHNVCDGSVALDGPNAESIGIDADGNSLVQDNTCASNHAGGVNGFGKGIVIRGVSSTVRGNSVTDNDGKGTGSAYGIFVTTGGGGTLVDQNNCCECDGGVEGYGIVVDATGVVVRSNTTAHNLSGGIRLRAIGSFGNACRAERNRSAERFGLVYSGTHSLGTGEDANISYYAP